MPITMGRADFLIHYIHAFTIQVTVLILLKGVLLWAQVLLTRSESYEAYFVCILAIFVSPSGMI